MEQSSPTKRKDEEEQRKKGFLKFLNQEQRIPSPAKKPHIMKKAGTGHQNGGSSSRKNGTYPGKLELGRSVMGRQLGRISSNLQKVQLGPNLLHILHELRALHGCHEA